MAENEKQFESNIEAFLISPAGGYEKATDAGYTSSSGMALDIHTLVGFVKATQPITWQRFEKQCNSDPYKKFYKCFEDAVQMDGLLSVVRHGFKHRGMDFKVCYFKPESTLNDAAVKRYEQNVCQCIRQWHYSEQNNNSVDMMLAINGIPVVAIELKNQLTGQNVDNAKLQWQYDRDQREPAFWLNHRILAYFAVDLYEAWMTTELKGTDTYGVYKSAKLKKPVKMTETMSPLEQVIEKINQKYMGDFTDGDRVVITTLHQKLKNNKKLIKAAKTDGRQIFENNIFPQLFDDVAQEAYVESTETYTKLFEDAGKYRAIMSALAQAMFDEMKNVTD